MWDGQDGSSQWHGEEDVEDTKGYSSKDSSFVVVSSIKDTPQSTKAEDQAGKVSKSTTQEIVEALKLAMENNQRTVELLLKASEDRGTSEAENSTRKIKESRLLNLRC